MSFFKWKDAKRLRKACSKVQWGRQEFWWHQWVVNQAMQFLKAALLQIALSVFSWFLEHSSFVFCFCIFFPSLCTCVVSFTEYLTSLTPSAFILLNTVSFWLKLLLPRRKRSRKKLLMRADKKSFLSRLVNGKVYHNTASWSNAWGNPGKFRATDVSFVLLLFLFYIPSKVTLFKPGKIKSE